MYFWDIERLKKDQISGRTDDFTVFPYFFVMFILYKLSSEIVSLVNAPKNATGGDWIAAFLTFAISVYGMYHVYRCNGGDRGEKFLNKLLPLMWVQGIRLAVIVIAILLPVVLVLSFAAPQLMEPLTMFTKMVLAPLLSIYFYWMMGRHFREVSVTSSPASLNDIQT